jgi:hypothetical protein
MRGRSHLLVLEAGQHRSHFLGLSHVHFVIQRSYVVVSVPMQGALSVTVGPSPESLEAFKGMRDTGAWKQTWTQIMISQTAHHMSTR